MSFAARLIHPLAIVTPIDTGTVDDYGQPVAGASTVAYVSGMVQPKKASEIALVSQGGAEVSDHTIFLLPRLIAGSAYIRDEPDIGRRFQVTGVRSFEFGRSPHLEVDAKLIGSTEGPEMGS